MRGKEAGKNIKGRKRHRRVETQGLLLTVVLHSAQIQDRDVAKSVFLQAKHDAPNLKIVWAEQGY